MMRTGSRIITILTVLLVCFCATISAQNNRERVARGVCQATSALNGVYRIDANRSDKLYSVIEGASTNLPYGKQQLFFIDLAVRLTPPDLLAIECRGSRVSLGSSRAPRVEFFADGVTRTVRNREGRVVRSRIAFERSSLTFASNGGDDNLSFTFTPLENGKSLRVTRRISARELIEPVVIQTVYNKIGETARWDIFDKNRADNQVAQQVGSKTLPRFSPAARSAGTQSSEAETLRSALNQWIDATNNGNIEKQMAFYMPELKAFYLTRNASRASVRVEKTRVFAGAASIDIRAAEPEIIFQDGGRTAVMRFRKKYALVNGSRNRRGEVIQELRWQRTGAGWRIFSERDIQVIS